MRRTFGKSYILEELAAIGQGAESHLTLFLIGGGAMAFRDLKDATKDIDVVTRRDTDFDALTRTLKDRGYGPVQMPEEEYAELGATAVLENEDGCRFDVFNTQVVNKLFFSKEMAARSEEVEKTGDLEFRAASPEDIFLFKSVAGRATDLDDMNTLVQTGLDFDTVEEELRNQIALLGEETFVTYIDQTLIQLEERHGVTLPLHREIEEISARVYEELEALQEIEGTPSIEDLREKTGLSPEKLKQLLESLEEKGIIQRTSDGVRKLGKRP